MDVAPLSALLILNAPHLALGVLGRGRRYLPRGACRILRAPTGVRDPEDAHTSLHSPESRDRNRAHLANVPTVPGPLLGPAARPSGAQSRSCCRCSRTRASCKHGYSIRRRGTPRRAG